MNAVDGRMCYAWKGWLFRAKNGVIEAKPVGSHPWFLFDVQPLKARGMPEPDHEIRARLPDLLKYWDKDV